MEQRGEIERVHDERGKSLFERAINIGRGWAAFAMRKESN